MFRTLPTESLPRLAEQGEVIQLGYKQVLFEQGSKAQHLALVISGCIALVRSIGTIDTLLSLLGPDHLIGAMDLAAEGQLRESTSLSLASTQVLLIPREIYQKNWLSLPELAIRVQKYLSKEWQGLVQARCTQSWSLESRIAHFLIRHQSLLCSSGQPDCPKLTRREIASSVGAQTESVIRVMSNFEKLGIIKSERAHIQIIQFDYLHKLIEGPLAHS